mmetsp:Transcript_17016/g.25514  ORF Transcript_17016/g.25514 Transcript_17016/m.25514 type:complete len:87 (+) Transcript_17016:130-390(+)
MLWVVFSVVVVRVVWLKYSKMPKGRQRRPMDDWAIGEGASAGTTEEGRKELSKQKVTDSDGERARFFLWRRSKWSRGRSKGAFNKK